MATLPAGFLPFGAPRRFPVPQVTAAIPQPIAQQSGQSPEETFSIGGSLISGLAGVGNFLDLATGASSVRDIASGMMTGDWSTYNPFDQFLTPFSDANRATGRDVLANAGITTFNDPNNWEFSDVGGFLAEVAMDPASYPAKLFGLGGQAAKTAGAAKPGLLDGPSLANVAYGNAFQAASSAIPGSVKTAIKKSSVGKAIADITEQTSLSLNKMFDASVMGRNTRQGQEAARKLFARQLASDQYVRSEIFPMLSALEKMDLLDDASSQLQRDMLEGIVGSAGAAADEQLQHAIKQGEQTLARLQSLGRDPGELIDNIRHAYRSMGAEVEQKFAKDKWSGRDGRPFSANTPQDTARQEYLKGFKKGTAHVNEVFTDPELDAIIQANAKKPNRAKRKVAEKIAEKYGNDIEALYQKTTKDGKLVFTRAGETGKIFLTKDELMSRAVPMPNGSWLYTQRAPFGAGVIDQFEIVPNMVNRYEKIASQMVNTPEFREQGIFTDHWLWDHYKGMLSANHQADAIESTYDLLAQPGIVTGSRRGIRKSGESSFTIGHLFREMKIKGDIGAENLLKRMNLTVPSDPVEAAKYLKEVRKWTINPDVVDDIRMPWKAAQIPNETLGPQKIAQSITAMWKAGVLTAPARYVRDLISGMMRNAENGWFGLKEGIDAHVLLQGGVAKGWENIPAVQQWLQRTGRQSTPETVSDALREMYASYRTSPIFRNTDIGTPIDDAGGINTLLDQLHGREQSTILQNIKNVGADALGLSEGTDWNPFNIRGVSDLKGNVRPETTFGPVVAGDRIGKYTDDMNRFVPFLNRLRAGEDPAEAMAKIMHAQVDYSPRNFTKTEQFLKSFFPFYSFSSRQIPYLAKTLAEHPGGNLGKLIRATRLGQGEENQGLPDYIASTTSIPISTAEDGTQRYLTGFGLMHEDPLSFLQWTGGSAMLPSTRDMLGETASRMSPFFKAPLEWATGESFFQRGPMGGRELADMDPLLGRLGSNIYEQFTGEPIEQPNGQAYPMLGLAGPFGQFGEHVLANSPVSRMLSTARTLVDPRKTKDGILPGAINTLTGARLSDVSPEAREGTQRERLQAYLRENYGAKKYEKIYFSREQIENTRAEDPETAGLMEAANKKFVKSRSSKATPEQKEEVRAVTERDRFLAVIQKRREARSAATAGNTP